MAVGIFWGYPSSFDVFDPWLESLAAKHIQLTSIDEYFAYYSMAPMPFDEVDPAKLTYPEINKPEAKQTDQDMTEEEASTPQEEQE